MKKYLLGVLLSLCFLVTTEAVSKEKPLVILRSETTVDLTNTGSTVIFSGLPDDFIACDVVFSGMDVSNTVGFAKVSIGWTGPNYTDISPALISPLNKTGSSINFNCTNSAIVPSNTPIVANVISPDIFATTNIQVIYIIGFYLF